MSRFHSIRKFKKSLWPSVPNLNKVLESFLTDISGSHWVIIICFDHFELEKNVIVKLLFLI